MENKTTPPAEIKRAESRPALIRLLIVIAIVLGFMIYSYGWMVTDVDLSVPQEPLRKQNLTLALRQLLSPRIFDQEREVERLIAPFVMTCDTETNVPEPEPGADGALISVEPTCGTAGDIIIITVSNSSPGADARIRWMPPEFDGQTANERPRELIETGREDFVLNADGSFTGSIEVPRIRGQAGDLHDIAVLVAVPSGPVRFSDTASAVIERMLETIFMALIATTVAIPIAAVISFFAARNLMRPIRLTVGTMLIYFISFIVGVVAANGILSMLAQRNIEVGGAIDGSMSVRLLRVVLALIIPVLWIVYLQRSQQQNRSKGKRYDRMPSGTQALYTMINALSIALVIIALASGALLVGDAISSAGESIQLEEPVTNSMRHITGIFIASVGNLLLIIGELLDLLTAGLISLVAGFAMASVFNTLVGAKVRALSGLNGRIVGAVLGVLGGGLIMAGMSLLGLQAALLGVLPVLIAAILGGQTLVLVVSALRGASHSQKHVSQRTFQDSGIDWVVFTIGAIGIGVLVFLRLNIGRALIDGTLPPQNDAVFLGIALRMTQYVFEGTMLGAVLGGIAAGITGVQGAFPLGNILYNFSRAALNTVRSIEPLIMGLVFVVWVGIGPFAGVLALTLHSIAALGKLYSEQIENIDSGPIEALQSTGANQLQTIVYAVVPQIVPPYIAFTMYRWDINVRMSTIIGFVGGGGIGLLLQQQINLLRYRDAGVAVLAIAIVVSILDYISAAVRERLT